MENACESNTVLLSDHGTACGHAHADMPSYVGGLESCGWQYAASVVKLVKYSLSEACVRFHSADPSVPTWGTLWKTLVSQTPSFCLSTALHADMLTCCVGGLELCGWGYAASVV